jgi:hypothetical protein
MLPCPNFLFLLYIVSALFVVAKIYILKINTVQKFGSAKAMKLASRYSEE